MDAILAEVREGIIEGDREQVTTAVQSALDNDVPAETILYDGLVEAMAEVGRLYEEGEYFVPEMLIAARAMKEGMAILKPHLLAGNIEPLGKVVAGTVQGDLHDIGKNLVCLMLEGSGFEIIDLGTDVKPEQFVDAVKEQGANIVALSALLTTTRQHMEATIKALEEAGVRDQVKVIVGGAPITDEFAKSIKADGFAVDASQAVNIARSLI